jgi:hypothetical protein
MSNGESGSNFAKREMMRADFGTSLAIRHSSFVIAHDVY